MRSLTICITTSRERPQTDWIIDSLQRQTELKLKFIIVSLHCEPHRITTLQLDVKYVRPKPCIWQGGHRITKLDWWAVCNARNTALCLCDTDWILFLDDRCVVQPGFFDAVRSAMDGGYIMAGSYEKRHSMTVENGVIKNGGIITAKDPRETHCNQVNGGRIMDCGGEWLFGCCLAMPMELALSVNGYPEDLCDSLSFEDCIFGLVLQNNGYQIRFDPRAKIIEDRTPELLGEPMKRTDKGVSPNDKSHKVLEIARTTNKFTNWFGDIRELRAKIQAGENFPIPDPNKNYVDWFDSQNVRDF